MFWLNSIRLHASEAPVLLVGTYLDQISTTDVQEINAELQLPLQPFTQIVANKEDGLQFFPISNKEGKGIDSLRKQTVATSSEQAFVHQMIHMRWLRCLDLITEESNGPWIPIATVKEFAVELGITTDAELDSMLEMYHELGVIIHFNSTNALQEVVVINPQWLIDEISKIIRDKEIHGHDVRELAAAGLEDDYNELNANAIASFDLLLYFWGKDKQQFFIDLMRHTLLLSDWNYGYDRSDKAYLIPSLLEESEEVPTLNPEELHICKFDFAEGFLPDGCFQRLLCLGSGSFQQDGSDSAKKPPLIYRSYAEWYLGPEGEAVYLKRGDDHILFAVQKDGGAAKHLAVIRTMLRKINEDTMDGGLKWSLQFMDPTGAYVSEEVAKKEKLSPWFAESNIAVDDATALLNLDKFLNLS